MNPQARQTATTHFFIHNRNCNNFLNRKFAPVWCTAFTMRAMSRRIAFNAEYFASIGFLPPKPKSLLKTHI